MTLNYHCKCTVLRTRSRLRSGVSKLVGHCVAPKNVQLELHFDTQQRGVSASRLMTYLFTVAPRRADGLQMVGMG